MDGDADEVAGVAAVGVPTVGALVPGFAPFVVAAEVAAEAAGAAVAVVALSEAVFAVLKVRRVRGRRRSWWREKKGRE